MTEPLVLIPGFMSDARLWGAQIESLSPHRSLILPALGDGGGVEEMAQAILAACPASFALAGHGLGASVAMEMLRRAPDRVARVAFLSAGCLAEPATAAAERETRLPRVKAGRLEAVMDEEWPLETFSPTGLEEEVQGFVKQMALGLGPQVYLRQARAMQRRPDQQRTLRQARLPALVIAGRHDRLVLPRRQQFLAGLMPRAEYVEVEAGHFPTIEAPDAVTAALEGWLAREAAPLLLR